MALPTSEVSVCNLALDLLKEAPIASIDTPTTKVETLCARWFDVSRASLIQSRNWSFASKSQAISRSGTPSVSIYVDSYTFPNDYLKLQAIIDPDLPLTRYKYDIQGKELLIDNGEESTLDIWYSYDNNTITQFPPLFTLLLTGRLALVIAYKITAKQSVIKEIKEFIIFAEKEALAFNGQERQPRRYERSRIVNVGLFPATLQQVAGNVDFDTLPT